MIDERKTAIQQISLSHTLREERLILATEADKSTRWKDIQEMQNILLQFGGGWQSEIRSRGTPDPILVPSVHLQELRQLQGALTAAVTNIIDRWWIDTESQFPQRMPVERHEEEVLRWMHGPGKDLVPSFATCQGSWRPDFLLEEVDDKTQYRICEINARFALNGFLISAFGQQAITALGADDKGLIGTAVPEEIFTGLLSLFNPSLPLHLLKGEEAGFDIHLFIAFVQSRTGRAPKLIKPSDLRLVADASSPTGFGLWCEVKDEITGFQDLECIRQVGLELHQRELRAMPLPVLHELARRSFNDFRTIFLVHDKRLLGIVLQEIDSLVRIHQVLDKEQGEILRRYITATIIPRSPELKTLTQQSVLDSTIKDRHILKPIRSGKGAGIIFGCDLTQEAWLSHLSQLQGADLAEGKTTYVVQKGVVQPRYDVMTCDSEDVRHNYLVGTYFSIHGHFMGLGIWRTSSERICAISRGGAWICSVTATDSGIQSSVRKREEGDTTMRDTVSETRSDSRMEAVTSS